jgi:biopolymer transport protein TolQ
MSNFNIVTAFLQAGLINQFLLVLLLLMSVYSWALVFSKFAIIKKHLAKLKDIEQTIKDKNLLKLETTIISGEDAYSKAVKLIVAGAKDKKVNGSELVSKVEVELSDINALVSKDLNKLATIANIAPFVGLLGTVIGVINSFQQIGLTASASLAVIAPGIAEALYATALGLFVAVPASGFYNLLSSKVDDYQNKKDVLFEKIFFFIKESM